MASNSDNDDYDSDPAGYDSYGSNDDGDSDGDSYNYDSDNYGSDGSYYKRKKEKYEAPSITIWRKDEDVGITEYCGDHKGFFAIIKQRYSDCVVSEINSQGEVHLTDESVPDRPKEKENIVSGEMPAYIPEEKIAEIDCMFDMDKKAEKRIHEVLIKIDGLEKQKRTEMHLFIKSRYKKVLTSTKIIDKEKYIQVRRAITDDHWNQKIPWPKLERYTNFVLYKENIDTMEAIKKLSSMLKVKPEMFSFAGAKDKRAKTTQLVSVPEVAPQRLHNVTKDNWAIKVGNFCFHHKPLKLGQFYGNRYKLVLRKISAINGKTKISDEVVNIAVENLKSHGFINYYGLHRFGTSHISNCDMGKSLLQGKVSDVLNLILTPKGNFYGEHYFTNMALQEYQKTGNAKEALTKLKDAGSVNGMEAMLLRKIAECENKDKVGLPKYIHNLYLQAYQSYIWNSIVSRRIKEFGMKVLPGDLVRQNPDSSKSEKYDFEESNEIIDAEDSTSLIEVVDDDSEKNMNLNIHLLTADEAKNTEISQILMPLPGHDILMPGNEIKKWYVEMLEKDGLSLEKISGDTTVRGLYRHLLVRPSDVSHTITYYNDVSKPLVQSDKQRLKGEDVEENKLEGLPGLAQGKIENKPETMDQDDKNDPTQSTDEAKKAVGTDDENSDSDDELGGAYGASRGRGAYGAFRGRVRGRGRGRGFGRGGYGAYGASEPVDPSKGRMKALILEMTLPASCYPSMAIRELLKFDSSTQYQNILDPATASSVLGQGISRGFGRGRFSRGRRSRGRRF